MATRSGSVDPGALLHLLRARRLTVNELDRMLEHESGLLGLSSGTGNVDELERLGSRDAQLALGVYTYRIAAAVATMAMAAQGLDALVFTAGVGEHSAAVREPVCARLAFLGVELDSDANTAAEPDTEIAASGSTCRVVVLRAREELVAARAARELLSAIG